MGVGKVERHQTLRTALRKVVSADLMLGLYCRKPPGWCRDHNRKILQLTLLRNRYTRAATVLEMGSGAGPDDVLAEKILDLCNGDWTLPYVQHFCWKPSCLCGGLMSTCVDTMSAVLEAVILGRSAERVPSVNRWHTVAPTLEAQGLGFMLHSVLPRIFELAGGATNAIAQAADVPEDSVAAFRAYNAAKDRKCRAFVGKPDAAISIGIACALTEPLDHLMARMQRLDDTGHLRPTPCIRETPAAGRELGFVSVVFRPFVAVLT
jgi:hypothetical protein